MATELKLRRGTTAQHASFTGAAGEVTVDTDKDTVVVHDGSTAGGFPLAKESGSTISAATLSVTGNTTLGDASGDSVTINASTVSTPNGLNFDSNTLVIDATNNRVGVGTSSPAQKLQIGASAADDYIQIGATNTGYVFGRENSTGEFLFNATQASPYNVFKWQQGGTERMRIDSSGNVGIGTSSPSNKLAVTSTGASIGVRSTTSGQAAFVFLSNTADSTNNIIYATGNELGVWQQDASANSKITFKTQDTERMRIDSSGNLLVGTTNTNPAGADINGIALVPGGRVAFSRLGGEVLGINRGTDDGTLVSFAQAGSTEGSISVSGTTVSYNGGHLSRWAQTTGPKDDTLVKGTVLSNLDEMNVYTDAQGNPVDNEQLNKVKVSDVEGDANVAGVFVNWTYDEDHSVDEINMAMTGDMIIRIAQGVTVARGDLLMSAGDGTAKPQGDDIVRSKTVAKVTSTHITCTYADGSYCVPCVLMAC